MKLFARFFTILFLFAVVPILLVGTWLLGSNEAARGNARALHEQLVRMSVDTVESMGADLNRSLAFVAELGRSGGKYADLQVLQTAAAEHPSLVLLSVLDKTGMETVRLADEKLFPQETYEDRSKDALVLRAKEKGHAQVGKVQLIGATPVLFIAHPLADGRLLYAGYSLKRLWERLDGLKAGASGRLLLLDQDGRPMRRLAEGFPVPGWNGPGRLSGDAGWLDSLQTKAGAMTGAFAVVPSFGWRALSLQPRREALAQPEGFAVKAVGLFVLLIVVVALAAFRITGQVARPLVELAAAAHRAAEHDFSGKVPEIGWGELNELSRAFNAMMQTLRAYQAFQIERMISEKAKVDGLVQNIPDAILLAGFDGAILYMNQVARALLGAGPDDGKTQHRVGELLRERGLREAAVSLMRRTARQTSVDVELNGADGNRLGIFSCRAAVIGAEGRDIGILMLLRDITHEKELDKMKEDFFQAIVHDLRTPLTTVDGYANFMMRPSSGVPEKERKYLDLMVKSCQRLRELVRDILDLAKLESGTANLELSTGPAAGILNELKELFTIQAQNQQVQLTFESSDQLLTCDHKLITRVLMNLIGNALKFVPKDGLGKIAVSVAPCEGDQLEFAVQDNGPGIPADKTALVFEKFKQLTAGVKQGGYGIGLSICQRIVQAHGGRIWVESDTGKGSRFVFRLPKRVAATASTL